MLKANFIKHTLNFKQASGTSRGVLHTKNSWIISVSQSEKQKESEGFAGKGEASIIENLSPDWNENYENKLAEVCERINFYASNLNELNDYPSIQFAIESALLDLKNGGGENYFSSDFTSGKKAIPINGLIWMGDKDFMEKQIHEKIEAGYSCIKLKIGTSASLGNKLSMSFEDELNLIKSIRDKFSAKEIELRVDANGAFDLKDVEKKLDALAKYNLHSIEQPIAPGQIEAMKKLCSTTPLPIALDEELIGISEINKKEELLNFIQPQYIILKPSLVGGFQKSDEWIAAAEKNNIGWWITSALESNIGLNAIGQYTFTKSSKLPQGLGTGQLFTNNFPSNLKIEHGELWLK